MVSSRTQQGEEAAISAMEIGAVDCIAKPGLENPDAFDDLAEKVRMAAEARVGSRMPPGPARIAEPRAGAPGDKIVAIGASTGGVEAVLAILGQYPRDCPPTLVTIHLPTPFTRTFADRLGRTCLPEVREATDGAPLLPGRIYLAPGTHTHLELARGDNLRCRLREGDPVSGHRPSVDVLFSSVARSAGAKAVGVILTGMGADGARGLLEMRRAGARTIGQDEATSIVYGMPKCAFQLGAVERQSPLDRIATDIADMTSSARMRS
jgi:two-component system chemotaxis response regulator CheB